jgi:nucleoid-associated protein YgaU
MARLDELLRSVSRHGANRSVSRRALALALCAMLAVGSVSPGAAFAAEADSEGEGGAAPGAAPEVEEAPEFEPGGEETALEELPELAPEEEAGDAEGEGEGPPVEVEPEVEAELPPVAEEATGALTGAAGEAVAPSGTEEGTRAEGPTYESAPPATTAPVENQALSAPESPPALQHTKQSQRTEQPTTELPPPARAPEQPRPPASPPAATPAEQGAAAHSLAGRRFHVVRAGESLWSIAKAMLPGGTSNAAIAREVRRLWRLNSRRIGTGDPGLIYAGTELRLR